MEDQEEDIPFKRQREVKTVSGTTSGLSGTSGVDNSTNFVTSNVKYVCPNYDTPKTQCKQHMKRFKDRKSKNILCPFCGMERGQYDSDDDNWL